MTPNVDWAGHYCAAIGPCGSDATAVALDLKFPVLEDRSSSRRSRADIPAVTPPVPGRFVNQLDIGSTHKDKSPAATHEALHLLTALLTYGLTAGTRSSLKPSAHFCH
jgi:hypothetical protein